MTVKDILQGLQALQNSDRAFFPTGVFPSYRYHPIFRYRRADDNVYFTAFILKTLHHLLPKLDKEEKEITKTIIQSGQEGISNYVSRLGDPTYNFYRKDGYFPNGRVLSKHKRFQPTDDSDDTAIAYRAMDHSMTQAVEAKKLIQKMANGQRDRWCNRSLKRYRKFLAYNTWIGSENLYVDLDICVIANVLCFLEKYDLPISNQDEQSIQLIEQAIQDGNYLKKKWAIAAWYPFEEVIFYQLSEILTSSKFVFSESVISIFKNDLEKYSAKSSLQIKKYLLEIAKKNVGMNSFKKRKHSEIDLNQILHEARKFSYGVIPLLHPLDGLFFQKIGAVKLFQLRYQCDAQVLAITLERILSED